MSSLPKPVLRGHTLKHGIKAVAIAITASVINSSIFYFFVKVPYDKKYANVMKEYDADKHYEDLTKWGYLVTDKQSYDDD